jgi:hypothetical protein
MQRVAQNWLVLTITGSASAFYLGLDTFLGEVPILLFTLIGGVVADRRDRRQLLLMSQFVQMGAAFALAALVFWDAVHVTHVLTLSVVTGLAQAFGGPAYQSLLPSLVEKRDLPNAIAFNSIQFNLARVIGPLLAGATLAAFGMAACFGMNGLSFLAVVLALLSLPSCVTSRRRRRSACTKSCGSGSDTCGIIGGLVGLAARLRDHVPRVAAPHLPAALRRRGLPRGVGLYTQLMAWAGGGAVTGALVVAWLGSFARMGRTLLVLQGAFAVLILLFAQTRMFWLNAILLFGAGAAMVMVFALLSSLVQLQAPNEMRGRVMSIYLMAFRGGAARQPRRGLAGHAHERARRAHRQRSAARRRGGVVPRPARRRARPLTPITTPRSGPDARARHRAPRRSPAW